MKTLLNLGTFILGVAIVAFAVDDNREMILVIVGMTIAVLRFEYKPAIGEAALRLLKSLYIKTDLLAIEIEREWRPMGGAESEAKRVIIAEMRDQIPPNVQKLIDKERAK